MADAITRDRALLEGLAARLNRNAGELPEAMAFLMREEAQAITRALAASPLAREEAPAEGAGDDALAEFLAGKFRANIYDHPHKSVTKSDEHTINLFADVAAEALRNRTSEPEAGAVANDNPLTFGMGALVVNTGKFGGDNAVFIAKATAPGEVGAYTGNSAFDRHTLPPGELVMIFPTADQVQAVADALVGPHPAPATADKLRVAVEALEAIADRPGCTAEVIRGSGGPPHHAAVDEATNMAQIAEVALAALNEQPQ